VWTRDGVDISTMLLPSVAQDSKTVRICLCANVGKLKYLSPDYQILILFQVIRAEKSKDNTLQVTVETLETNM